MKEIGEGTQLGRCRLTARIGQGSMGDVWEAWHTTLGISVAVKILREPSSEAESSQHRERFRQEAHIAARVNHPNLVRVLDFGEEHARPYLVMELVRGPTLEAWLRQQPRIDERTALKVAGHVCVGLSGLHHFGVVHRDIKPSNVLIEAGQMLKISDLGLARDPSISHPESVAGTPQYLAPECLVEGAPYDVRSDLYAVGVILYRLLMGRLPFLGTTQQVLFSQIWEQPDWTVPDGTRYDAGTFYILKRLMEKEPERRIQSAVEAIQACREQVQVLDMHLRMRKERPKLRMAEEDAREKVGPPQESAAAVRWSRAQLARWVFRIGLGALMLVGAFAAGRAMVRP
jgi:eukaryotic-like serine/threonine-protein kinase